MKVKLNNIIYDSEKQPIVLVLSQEEKELIGNMSSEDFKFCSFPEDMTIEKVQEFMKMENNPEYQHCKTCCKILNTYVCCFICQNYESCKSQGHTCDNDNCEKYITQ